MSETRDPAPSIALPRSAILKGVPAWEWEFDWHLTNRCNFLCEYCHPQIRTALNRKHLKEPPADLVVRRFDESGSIEQVVRYMIDHHMLFVALRDGEVIVRDSEGEAILG